MLSSVQFRNFKALRATAVQLGPCNLLLGPNGSGKTSLIQALLRLRTLAALPPIRSHEVQGASPDGPQIVFRFAPPYADIRVTLSCHADELVCNLLVVDCAPEAEARWAELRTKLQSIRAYLFDHYAIAVPDRQADSVELASNGGNLAAVLAGWQEKEPAAWAALTQEFVRLMPEFSEISLRRTAGGTIDLGAQLAGEGGTVVPAENLSQGTLYLLAILTLAFNPRPPAIVCLEEADRGMHPRSLRDVRDSLYRLSYPGDAGLERAPVQVVTTTHSPYLLDQFREHPEEVILASKHGQAATLQRLSDRPDILELIKEANLGDLWYSGILGGVPGQ